MATKLTKDIVRAVEGLDGKEYTVRITSLGVVISEKGTRTRYGPVSWGTIYLKGAMQEADAQREAKRTTPRRVVRRGLLR